MDSCSVLLATLSRCFYFWTTWGENAILDPRSRCNTRYFQDEPGFKKYLVVLEIWTSAQARDLVMEVIQLMDELTGMGITKAFWIQQGDEALGCSFSWKQDRIFVQCGGVRHPFDIISTTLHELGHQFVYQTRHQCYCKTSHCLVWQRCVKNLSALFTQAPKTTPLLKTLDRDYGKDWGRAIVSGISSCNGCSMSFGEVCRVRCQLLLD